MPDDLKQLQSEWKNVLAQTSTSTHDVAKIIGLATKRKSNTVKTHVVNILILLLTLLGIAAYFTYVAHFRQTLSHVGQGLMMGGLMLRILIECFSIYLSTTIDLTQPSAKTNDSFLQFYGFRKRIHGPVTMAVLLAYTVGFYMLTPEFSLVFSLPILILLNVSYVAAALIFTTFIRRGIKKEMNELEEISKLQNELLQP